MIESKLIICNTPIGVPDTNAVIAIVHSPSNTSIYPVINDPSTIEDIRKGELQLKEKEFKQLYLGKFIKADDSDLKSRVKYLRRNARTYYDKKELADLEKQLRLLK